MQKRAADKYPMSIFRP